MTSTKTLMPWYRNAGRTKYHQAAPGWIESGLAACGANVRRPVYEADTLAAAHGGHGAGVCKTCEKKAKNAA